MLTIFVIIVIVIAISLYLFILSQTGSTGSDSSFEGTFIGIEKNSKNINGAHTFMGLIPTTFYKDSIIIKTSDGNELSIPISSKSEAFKLDSDGKYRHELSFTDIPKGARVTGWCRLTCSINASYSAELKEITLY